MRRAFLVLLPLALAGCVRDSATHYINGRDHTITVRAEQEYFWDERLRLTLATARLPECQRVFPLRQAADGVDLSLYATGEDTFTLKSPDGTWTFETRACTMLQPSATPGQLLGTYRLENKEMVFTAAKAATPQ
jgi:hypothetical protein